MKRARMLISTQGPAWLYFSFALGVWMSVENSPRRKIYAHSQQVLNFGQRRW